MTIKAKNLVRPIGWKEVLIFIGVLGAAAVCVNNATPKWVIQVERVQHFSGFGKPMTTIASLGMVGVVDDHHKILPYPDHLFLSTDAASIDAIKGCADYWNQYGADVVPMGHRSGPVSCYVRVPGEAHSVPHQEALKVIEKERQVLKSEGRSYWTWLSGKKSNQTRVYAERPTPIEARILLKWAFGESTPYQESLFAKLELADCPQNPHQDKCRTYLR